MNFQTTLILLVLLAIVGIYFLFFQQSGVTRQAIEEAEQQRAEQRGAPVFDDAAFDRDDVIRITLAKPGEKEIVLEKQGQEWRQVAPVAFPLDKWDVQSIIDAAADMQWTEKLRPGYRGDTPTLEEMQLEPPLVSVTFDLGSGDAGEPDVVSHTVHVGKKALGGRGFVRIGEASHVYVVRDALHRDVLDEDVTDWRKMSIASATDISEGQSDRIALQHGDVAIELRKADGDWTFADTHSGRVDRQAVTSLLNAVTAISVHEFHGTITDDLSLYGLQDPRVVVRVYQAVPETPAASDAKDEKGEADAAAADEAVKMRNYTLRVGAPTDLTESYFFATWASPQTSEQVVFDIAKATVEKFTGKKVADLRDPRITVVNADNVKEIKLVRAGQDDVKLIRGAEGWAFGAPGPEYGADDQAVSKLIEALTKAQATDYRTGMKSGGEGDPAATVILTAVAGEPDVLKIFKASGSQDATKAGDQWMVLRNDESVGYIVDAGTLEPVFAPVRSLRQRQLLTLSESDVTKLTVAHPGGPTYVFDRQVPQAEVVGVEVPTPETDKADKEKPAEKQPTWKLIDHERFEAQSLKKLLDMLLKLEADAWLADDAKPSGDLVTVTIAHQADDSPTVLKVAPDTRRATLSTLDMPFTVSAEFVEALTAEFRYRTVLNLSAADIKQVSVEKAGETTVIERTDDGQFTSPAGTPLDASAAGALFDTLSPLRVGRYLAQGEPPTGEDATVVTITGKDDKTHKLHLAPKPAGPHKVGDQLFTLTPATHKKLTATLVQSEDEQIQK